MAGIPQIAPYSMPEAGELPGNTASWTVDSRRAVLLLHDMQNFFLEPFPAGRPPVVDLVGNATALRNRCARLGIPVAYTGQPGNMTEEQRGLLREFWGPGMTAEPSHRDIVAAVAPAPGDWLFTKWRYSAFHRTTLLSRMRESGRDQLILAGVYAHVGILMTAVDAFTNDIQPFLVADAIADFTAADHRMTLDYAARRCGVTVTTEQVLADLSAAPDLSPTPGLAPVPGLSSSSEGQR
ncbi:isochorismatase family protein [Microbispora sp. NPDC049633]|uniref:isochorismatase family protein n=1 Tax=Microbispora sp. NPDC049633 TaxID=3154355 RepID=UPI0034313084